jgi:hypothetical protein
MSRLFVSMSLVIAMLLTVGCSGSGQPPVAAVSGTVNYQGKPIEGAAVMFAPTGQEKPATGTTDAEGNFGLTTFAAGDGAMPGTYKVTISKTVVNDPWAGKSPDEISEANAQLRSQGKPVPKAETKYLVPEKYASVEKTPESATVKADGENKFVFNLQD